MDFPSASIPQTAYTARTCGLVSAVLHVQIRAGEAAARAKEVKKQQEAREAEMKRQSKDQEKLKKLNKEFARSGSRRLISSSNHCSFHAV